jgi:hypothetical protein
MFFSHVWATLLLWFSLLIHPFWGVLLCTGRADAVSGGYGAIAKADHAMVVNP